MLQVGTSFGYTAFDDRIECAWKCDASGDLRWIFEEAFDDRVIDRVTTVPFDSPTSYNLYLLDRFGVDLFNAQTLSRSASAIETATIFRARTTSSPDAVEQHVQSIPMRNGPLIMRISGAGVSKSGTVIIHTKRS